MAWRRGGRGFWYLIVAGVLYITLLLHYTARAATHLHTAVAGGRMELHLGLGYGNVYNGTTSAGRKTVLKPTMTDSSGNGDKWERGERAETDVARQPRTYAHVP
jgi:hypothetical protein